MSKEAKKYFIPVNGELVEVSEELTARFIWHESLTKRYETAAAELARLQNLRTLRSQKDKAVALYIRTLKKQPTVLSEWNDTLWTVMVEKAIVHRNSEITFVFYNGTKVKVRQ